MWLAYLWILWCFALRPGEATDVLPSHLSYDPPGKRKKKGQWILTVIDPKVMIHNPIQHVVLDEDWCPPEAIQTFKWFSSLSDQDVRGAGTSRFTSIRRKLSAILKSALPPPRGMFPFGPHCFRHGRTTQMAKGTGYRPCRLPQHVLQTVGRWAVLSSLRVYMHF